MFHGSSLLDYQGRSWMKPPSALKPDGGEHACFIPKKCTKKLAGHTKGVQAIEFFPNTGHLLLSASMDRCSAMVASVMYVCMSPAY